MLQSLTIVLYIKVILPTLKNELIIFPFLDTDLLVFRIWWRSCEAYITIQLMQNNSNRKHEEYIIGILTGRLSIIGHYLQCHHVSGG